MNTTLVMSLALSVTSLPPVTKAVLIIKLTLAIAPLATMLIASIWYRVALEKKLRELLPNEKNIKRLPPFFIINISQIQNSKEGDLFKRYFKMQTKRFLIIFAAAVVVFAAGIFIPEPISVR